MFFHKITIFTLNYINQLWLLDFNKYLENVYKIIIIRFLKNIYILKKILLYKIYI